MDNWIHWCVAGVVIAVGLLGYVAREARERRRSVEMEVYLRAEKEAGKDRGHRSTKQLMLKLGLTARQVLAASRRSAAIKRLATTENFPGAVFTDLPVFEYAPLLSQETKTRSS